MRLVTRSQAKEIDTLSVKAYGLTDDILMEAAGLMAAREIQQNFFPELNRGLTAVVCGPGNNGGDGLVLARHLHSMGYRNLVVVLAAPSKKQSKMFRQQLNRAEKHGLRFIDAFSEGKKLEQLKSSELIIDAVFGTGFSKNIDGPYLTFIEKINSFKKPIVALDVASGLNSDTGIVRGIAIRAHTTLTFGLAKPGFFVADGPSHTGKLRVLPIGYPYECLRGVATTHFIFNDKLARRYLPLRKDRANKSDFGRLVLMAGNENTWGAGVLAAQSAYRMGAGYVVWAGNDIPFKNLESTPEVLTSNLQNEDIWNADRVSAYAVGPGFGIGNETVKVIRRLIDMKFPRVVLDADAITVCVKHKLFPLPQSWILTPHNAELARILNMDVAKIENDRYAAALKAAELTGAHVLLKGFRSILAYQGRCMVILSGNSALAKAGSGDVLTGMIGSLLAQGLDTVQATATAAYIHGRIADEWVRNGNDKRSLNPSDIKDHLGPMLSRLAQGAIF